MPPGRNQRQGFGMGFSGPNQPNRPRQQGFRGAPSGFPNQNSQPMTRNMNTGGLFGQRRDQGNQAQPEPNQGGGFLARILGKNKQGSASTTPFAPPRSSQVERSGAAAGTAAGLLEGGTISSMISNTQRVLQAAEQIGPMVQQYGPMVKNIPSMWKLYQAMKSSSSDDTEKKNTSTEVAVSEQSVREDIESEESDAIPVKKAPRKKKGSSSPKLYV